MEKAYEKGLCIVLNPSSRNENIEKINFNKLSYLILNEIEAETLSGCKEPEISLKYFGERYPDLKVVLTLGKKGSIFYQKAAEIYQPAFLAEAVDTTAAGDTFTGYFIAGIAAHGDVEKALRSASAAAAIAVSRHGAGTFDSDRSRGCCGDRVHERVAAGIRQNRNGQTYYRRLYRTESEGCKC